MESIEPTVTNHIWLGSIPVVISLAENDNANQREPLHFMALRCAYLPLYAPTIKAHFFQKSGSTTTFTIDEATELWYDFRGLPLKWHYPIGLLHDILSHSSLPPQQPTQSTEHSLIPWKITLHISSFPADKLFKSIPVPSLQTDPPRDFFMNSLKESEFIRHITTKKVMALSKTDQMLLWDTISESVRAGALETTIDQQQQRAKLGALHDKFWSVNARLMGEYTHDATSPVGGVGQVRSVAVRLYVGWDKPFLQELVAPGPEITLLHAIRVLAPALVPSDQVPSAESAGDPLTNHMNDLQLKGVGSNESLAAKKEFKVITHGVEIPLETPLLWLSRNFSYPDNFLHLVLG
ncbi:APG5-domain-containing protein [Rhizoclosmatium globosum]|uniref:Autophagy protein 5 n=1 Tax=Rhizoclosmatium globosum TaxID=329046 RepID=A0A1Y2CS21_9FUNG|nr:APG5-domain-containing protein [Rhizoclosmatium globosum]|eukprot:ORY49802.1 APG5-domain-containing protein [Rhizoclosmatium globosum]